MDAEQTLNSLLVNFFRRITTVEEERLITDEFKDITYNDMHVIEAIGLKEPRKMSKVAKEMLVTTGTLTKAIDSLEKKGYVKRQRSAEDKRVVNIILTERGVHAYRHHERFHQEMVAFVLDHTSKEESEVLRRALEKLLEYFQLKYMCS